MTSIRNEQVLKDAVESICRVCNGMNGDDVTTVLASAAVSIANIMAMEDNRVSCEHEKISYRTIGLVLLIEKISRAITGTGIVAKQWDIRP